MLLKLISENQENRIEFAILGKVEALDTVSIEPFLQYARRLLRERTKTMTGEAGGVACYTLSRHGTKEDEALLEWVIEERPYVASEFTDGLKILRDRLNPPRSASRPERRDAPSSNAGMSVGPVEVTEDYSQDGSSAISQTEPWIIPLAADHASCDPKPAPCSVPSAYPPPSSTSSPSSMPRPSGAFSSIEKSNTPS